jgi:uncharacterized protein involved in outer membrane biogenesis
MRIRNWLRRIFILALALFAASFGLSRMLRTGTARRFLIAHLEASFGRPVEVGRFDFSLLDGARLKANSITISEDPRFGHEYFLRADTLTAGLRWVALFAGRFEFGALSLSRPSLNLVRDAQGRWNVEQCLPPAPSSSSPPGLASLPAAPRSISTARLYRVDINGGRINFKQGDDKSSLALIDVSGRVEQDNAGRWALDVEAQPTRAGVKLQEIGTLGLRGSIAGTSARLQPAELNLTWNNVSLADALRLSRESDSGLRGNLTLELDARVVPSSSPSNQGGGPSGAQWSISGVARMTGLHGWRLPGRNSDPAANLSFDAAWRLGEARTQIRKILVEMPNSHLQGAGDLDWSHGLRPELHVNSSRIGLADVLAWYRALRPDIPESLSVAGTLGVDATLSGWPPQIEHGGFTSAGGRLTAANLPSPLKIGPINVSLSPGGLDFAPTEISFEPAASVAATGTAAVDDASPNSFTLRGTISTNGPGIFHWPANWSISIEGGTSHIESWLALSEALAQPLNSGRTAAGGLAVKMRGVRKVEYPATVWLGTMDLRNVNVSPAYLNEPLGILRARIEFAQAQRTILLSAAEAFGATWRGSIARKNTDGKWTFDISAEHLDAADLDRWLGPRARPGPLTRFAGFGKSPAANSQRDAAVAGIAARGRLRISEIVLSPLHFEQFDGEVELAGRAITVRKAQANFFGGKAAGSLEARLLADPSYQFRGRFDRVDLARLGQAIPSLSNRISGTASADLDLHAHGVGRETLVRFIQGDGKLDARNAQLRGLNFASLISARNQDSSSGQFASARGKFTVGAGGIEVTDFVLENSQGRFQADGRIDFSRALNLSIHPSIFHAATTVASAPPPSFVVSGTVEAPSVGFPLAPVKSGARTR